MVIIDAQVHAYERDHPGRPWAGVLTGPAEVTGDAMVAAMDAVGVDGAVLVSPFTMYGYDSCLCHQSAHLRNAPVLRQDVPLCNALDLALPLWAA